MIEQYSGGRRDEGVQTLFSYIQGHLLSDQHLNLFFKGNEDLKCKLYLRNDKGVWKGLALIDESIRELFAIVDANRALYFNHCNDRLTSTILNSLDKFSSQQFFSLHALAGCIFGPIANPNRVHAYNSNLSFVFKVSEFKEHKLHLLSNLCLEHEISEFISIKDLASFFIVPEDSEVLDESNNVQIDIQLLPPEQQINAIYRLPDANFLNEMISCHTEGCTIQEMVDTIKANGAYTQAYLGSLPRQLNRGYDFFGLDGELVYANEVSQAYAEGNPEPMMLAAFRNFFLLAETLEWLNRHPESSPTQIRDAINTHYPNWNNDKQPADRVWWLRFFGLASPAANEKLIGKVVSITDKGRRVLARMDFTERILIGDATEIDIDNTLPSVAYVDILQEIEDLTDLILNHKQLKGIHNGLHANPEKRFIILSGLSGTGKTKMLQEYAEAYCRLLNLDSSDLVKLVSITPAFRDHTHLLGYLNPLTKPPSYVMGELTQFLLNALENPQYPFFLILDEMNLARVEFYLAPILSAMESRTAIALHDSTEINSPPNALRCWPSNVFLAGTVNMDETTHAFSDKVLDRAFTMEFWDIDLKEYFKRNPTDRDVQSTITSLYDALKPAHLHFGYRTVKAIVDYVNTAIETDPDDKMDALDQAVFSKVLPKLRGQQSTELVDALNAVLITCQHLALSKTKIESMLHRLNETGLTRFWR